MWRAVGIVAALACCGRIDFDGRLSDAPMPDADARATPGLVSVGTGIAGGSDDVIDASGLSSQSGHLLVAAILTYTVGVSVTSVVDNADNLYVAAPNARATSMYSTSEIWYAANCVAGVQDLKVNFDGQSGGAVWYAEFDNVALESPLDKAAEQSGSAAPEIDAPTVPTMTQNELVVSVVEVSSGSIDNVAAPFVDLPTIMGDDAAYGIAQQPASYGAKWTAEGSGDTVASTAAFEAAPQ